MDKAILTQFEEELEALIDKYSHMELTNAEAIGVLECAKHRILTQDEEDDDPWAND